MNTAYPNDPTGFRRALEAIKAIWNGASYGLDARPALFTQDKTEDRGVDTNR